AQVAPTLARVVSGDVLAERRGVRDIIGGAGLLEVLGQNADRLAGYHVEVVHAKLAGLGRGEGGLLVGLRQKADGQVVPGAWTEVVVRVERRHAPLGVETEGIAVVLDDQRVRGGDPRAAVGLEERLVSWHGGLVIHRAGR